ncbi:MAG TPA: twin-arginine translocase TatA/TatE family subunit [Solirubrobacterales bacterium]|jgi:sec-independent protein translocase protein TatA
MPSVGPLELAIVLIIALVVFGPKRLPELGKSLGTGMREFKDSITGRHDEERQRERTQRELEKQSPATTREPEEAEEPAEGEVVSEPRD